MTHDEMIAVIAAHRDGKEVQSRHKYSAGVAHDWADDFVPEWDFRRYEYRRKPALPPKPREWWIIPVSESTLQTTICVKKPTNPDFIHVREVLPSTGQDASAADRAAYLRR